MLIRHGGGLGLIILVSYVGMTIEYCFEYGLSYTVSHPCSNRAHLELIDLRNDGDQAIR